jgi:hypothetical protein
MIGIASVGVDESETGVHLPDALETRGLVTGNVGQAPRSAFHTDCNSMPT